MPLDPQAAALIQQMQALGAPPLNEMSPEQAREAAAGFAQLAGAPEPVASIINRTLPGPRGDIPVRIYTPEGQGELPVIVYFHGGGWVLGTLDTVDVLCTQLANRASAVVVSVDYRLAPEHKFPAAADDCFAALRWVADHARELNADPQRLAVAGDSAGGNLAAVSAAMARDAGTPSLVLQVLFCPVTNHAFETPSYRDNGRDYFLTTDMMRWFWDLYLTSTDEGRDWRASPLGLSDLSGLPPAYIVTAEYDPLRDEAEAYAERLQQAGIPVTLRRYDGQIHDFITMAGAMGQAGPAVEAAAAALRAAFTAKVPA